MKKSITKTYKIVGLDCASCALALESDLEDAGISSKCNIVKETLEVNLENPENEKIVKKILDTSGYSLA